MKKKIKLTDFKVESFITGADASINTRDYQGGNTKPAPGSGICIECIVSDLNYSLECCEFSGIPGCEPNTFYGCGETGMAVCFDSDTGCNNTSHYICGDTFYVGCGAGGTAG